MKRTLNQLIVAFATLTFISCTAPARHSDHAAHAQGSRFDGIPYDIDYIKNAKWTQVLLLGTAPNGQLTSQTTNDHIEGILLVALSSKTAVSVEYVDGTPKRLTAVHLMLRPMDDQGHVEELSADEQENYCRAVVVDNGQPVKVWTKSAQMRGILETAVRQANPVQQFAYDPTTYEITRGKVNVDVKK